MPDELKITCRHLPHWTIEGAIYFVTFRAHKLAFDSDEQRIIIEHLREGDGKFYDCFAAMVMPDHVHLLLRPKDGISLTRIMHGIKGAGARRINQHRRTMGKVWQSESYDRIVRDQAEFDAKLNYMLNNPVKKRLTEDPGGYVGWYLNKRLLGYAPER
jgi:REP element-mobilizing transposase RayT